MAVKLGAVLPRVLGHIQSALWADWVVDNGVWSTEGGRTLCLSTLGRANPAASHLVPAGDFMPIQGWFAAPGFQPGVPKEPCSKANRPPRKMCGILGVPIVLVLKAIPYSKRTLSKNSVMSAPARSTLSEFSHSSAPQRSVTSSVMVDHSGPMSKKLSSQRVPS